jgi:[pyruvate, water dikinase]-phosphate phosphotransferase / [pyruvate, water dikinase] kinase
VKIMLTVYAVSDSIGETAELVSKAISSQFSDEIKVKRVPYVKTIQEVNNLIDSISLPSKSVIISSIVLVDIREYLVEKCAEKGISISNILSPGISLISKTLNKLPEHKPGSIWEMDEDYFKKIHAIEFAIQYDDSKDYRGLKFADVILVGLSRTSKTPLSMYLANKGIKVLNVPLVPEVPLPKELFELDSKKIIGLKINPLKLIEIRKHRMEKFNITQSNFNYADEARILDELEYSDKIMRRLRCKTIDVTDRAIEDTALIVMKTINHNSF